MIFSSSFFLTRYRLAAVRFCAIFLDFCSGVFFFLLYGLKRGDDSSWEVDTDFSLSDSEEVDEAGDEGAGDN